MRSSLDDVCGCFPTGRHYPGIAEHLAEALNKVEGLCEEFAAADTWSDLPMAVIDFETTGVNAEADRIIEIGIAKIENGQVVGSESILVDPQMPIPEESRAVHGITDEELEGAPPFSEIVEAIGERLEGYVPVAYNANFDRGFLLAEFKRAKSNWPQGRTLPPAFRDDVTWLDPLVWARHILTELRSKRLGEVAKHFSIPLEKAHRAGGDAEATAHVLMALSPKMPPPYGEVVRMQQRYSAAQEAQFAEWRNRRR